MSWEDSDGIERGGGCNECGEPVEEEHHAYCESCYREMNGWSSRRERPDADALRWQHADRERVITSRLVERLDALEIRAARSAVQIEALARRVDQLERADAYHLCRGTAA